MAAYSIETLYILESTGSRERIRLHNSQAAALVKGRNSEQRKHKSSTHQITMGQPVVRSCMGTPKLLEAVDARRLRGLRRRSSLLHSWLAALMHMITQKDVRTGA